MKILSYIRGASVVEVGMKDDDGKISVRRFPKSMSDAEINAVLNGGTLPEQLITIPATGKV